MKDLSKLFTQLITDALNGSDTGAHVLGSLCSKLEDMGYDISMDGEKINPEISLEAITPGMKIFQDMPTIFPCSGRAYMKSNI